MAVPRGVNLPLLGLPGAGAAIPQGVHHSYNSWLWDKPVYVFFQFSNVFFHPRGMVVCNFNLLHFSSVVLFALRHKRFFSSLNPPPPPAMFLSFFISVPPRWPVSDVVWLVITRTAVGFSLTFGKVPHLPYLVKDPSCVNYLFFYVLDLFPQ